MDTPLPPNAGVIVAPSSIGTTEASALLASATNEIAAGHTAVVIDCSAVESIDAGGAAGLAWLAASVGASGCTSHLYAISAAALDGLAANGSAQLAFSSVAGQ